MSSAWLPGDRLLDGLGGISAVDVGTRGRQVSAAVECFRQVVEQVSHAARAHGRSFPLLVRELSARHY